MARGGLDSENPRAELDEIGDFFSGTEKGSWRAAG